jgi:O-antigen/teichoic acid export membrane protein
MTQSAVLDSPEIETPPASGHNLAASVGRNTVFGIISGATNVATRLITIPFVIAHLGLGGYGIWSIIMTTAAYMRFGAVGVKSAFQKYVAEATGDGDYEKASRLLSTGCGVMLLLSVVGLVPVFFFSGALARVAGVPSEFLKPTSNSISVLALIMIMSNVGAVFEAILMGGHRIDIARRFSTTFVVAEAIAIMAVLHQGYGLLAMASVMGISEVCYVFCCYLASRKIMPQIIISAKYMSSSVLRELARFAGSYQLVNLLQVLYAALLPVAVLRAFGADRAGIYALSLRMINPAQMLEDAFLLSILSGGSMVYASGAVERMQQLLHKSYKITFAFAFIPMAFIAMFGPMIVFAWTGQNSPEFHQVLILVSVAGVFQAVSILGLVLYRISGNAILDNIRQVLVLVTLFVVSFFARRLGFHGVLAGLAFAELLGMFFMIYAVARTFHLFRPVTLLSDALKALAATAGIIAVGVAVSYIPLPFAGARAMAWGRLGVIFAACALASIPALLLTRFVDLAEGKRALRAVLPRRFLPIGLRVPLLGVAD